MALVRWDPFRELEDMSARLSRLAGLTPREQDDPMAFFAGFTPAVDIEETDKEYVVRADLPAMKKEEVKINIEDGVLAIEGERKQEKEEKTKKYHRTERTYGRFVRRLAVPPDVDRQKIAADYKDGVLTVRMPKAPAARPAAIDVKIA